jgi:endonuclease/exonuclease/phosphatase family metal-dependent hydrolase
MNTENEFAVMTINAGGGRRAQTAPLNPKQLGKDLAILVMNTMKPVTNTDIVPDIIAIQESHRVWPLWDTSYSETIMNYMETSNELARALGSSYRSFFFSSYDSDSHANRNKWEKAAFNGYSRAMQGNAIIPNIGKMNPASWPWPMPKPGYPMPAEPGPISTQISVASLFSTGNRDTEPRNLIVLPLKIKVGDKDVPLYFMATHLTTLTGEDRHDRRILRSREASNVRLAQAREIIRTLNELRDADKHGPVILAGDFNAVPGSPEISELENAFVRPQPVWDTSSPRPIYTHADHKIHVDHIFYNDPCDLLTLEKCFVPDPNVAPVSGGMPVTDHLPLVAIFEVNPRPSMA